MFLHLLSYLLLSPPPTSVGITPASCVSARAVALCCFAGKLPLSLRAAKMFLHLSSSLQLASPPTSVVRTPASGVSARAVALCCFAGKLPLSLRAAKMFLHLSSSLCIAAAHDLLRSAANQTRIFDAQTLIPRRLRICITLQTMQATPAESCRTF